MTDWSGYFDGSGDYLSVADSAVLDLNTTFTVEAWFYKPTVTDGIILGRGGGTASWSATDGHEYILSVLSGTLYWQFNTSGVVTSLSTTAQTQTWNHVAVGYNGTTTRVWLNGVSVATSTNGYTLPTTRSTTRIGYTASSEAAFPGWISNLRIVKGTDVYGVANTSITVPTAPLTAITNTSLLTCQSSTFVDNSANELAITVNGNSYTTTLNNPFNSPVNYTTPPLQAWSNYFNGGSDRLSNASASVMDVGTGNFTIEMWVFLTSTANQMLFEGSGNAGLQVLIDSGILYGGLSGTSAPVSYTIPSGFTNTWHHIAYVRGGTGSNQVSLYVDGIRRSQGTLSNSVTTTGFQISRTSTYLVYGYISNLRVVKNSAVYTGATITVPTEPLTAIANTSLLTCQSNRFIDNSINAFAITVSGNTSVQPFSPFNPTAAYSAGTVGGSGYFDGTGDDLTTPSNAAFTYGTGDFTIEGFYFFTGGVGPSGYSYLFAQGGGTGITSLGVYIQDGVYRVWNGSAVIVGTTAYAQNRWVHIALARSGTTLRLFVNGVLDGSATNSNSIASGSTIGISIGRWVEIGDLNWITGYVSNFRIVKGTALYTANFTVPTTPLTNITNTSLLLNYTNGGIIDATAKNVLETVGNAQISTAQSKFGGSSMSFDGSGDYLIGSSQLFAVGSGNFTLEAWVYLNANPATEAGIISSFNTGGGTTGFYLGINSTGRPFNTVGNGNIVNNTVTATSALTLSTWTHIAGVRVNGTLYLYVNGVSTGTPISNTGSVDRVLFGLGLSYPNSPQAYLNGYVDDARVSRFARYTTNFTPPTQAFPLF